MGDNADHAVGLALARDPGSTSSKQKQHSLVDMPAPWLDQLSATITPEAALALVRACSTFRDLVLAQRLLRVHFHLPIAANAMRAARTKLQLACKYSHRVKLQLVESRVHPWAEEQQSLTDIDCSATALLLSNVVTPPSPITSVELKGLILDALVPAWIIFGCPHMTSLQLQSCSFTTLPECNMGIPSCPQLKQLRLLTPPPLADQPTFLRWQHQLEALPGLQSLTLGGGWQQVYTWCGCCSIVGTQLTQLILLVTQLSVAVLPPQFPSWFPCVRDLQLPNVQVHDGGGMDTLLAMTSIRHLACHSFHLQQSYTHRTCSWSQLSVRSLDVKSFAMLPMDNIQSFSVIPPNPLELPCDVLPCTDLNLTRKVVAAITRCGGLQWGNTDRVSIGRCTGADGLSVAELLPLMSGCRATALGLWEARPLTAELLASVQPFMAALPLTTMKFGECTWEGDAVGLVLPSLPPHVHTLELKATAAGGQGPEGQLTEAQLTRMCVAAGRPVTVQVKGYSGHWEVGWKQRVRAAMAAAGHEHVALVDG